MGCAGTHECNRERAQHDGYPQRGAWLMGFSARHPLTLAKERKIEGLTEV